MTSLWTVFKSKAFIENFLSHSVIQLAVSLLPLITIPYLTRVLGLEVFGLYVYILALLHFLEVFVAYGFRVSATKSISRVKDHPEQVALIFWEVIYSKALIFFTLLALVSVFYLFLTGFNEIRLTFVHGTPLLLGNVLFVVWLYQGLQKVKVVAAINLVSKVLFVGSIFTFVKSPEDLNIAVFCYGFSYFAVGFLSFIFAIRLFSINHKGPSLLRIVYYLKDAWDIFLAQLLVSFYSSINILVLGWVNGPASVAYYSLGDKIYKLLGSFASPFSRTLFPVLSAIDAREKGSRKEIMVGSLVLQFLAFGLGSLIVSFFAIEVLSLLSGSVPEFNDVVLLQIFCIAVPFFVTNSLSTYQLVSLGKERILRKIVSLGAFLNCIAIFPAIHLLGSLGVAILVVIVQVFLCVLQVYYVLFDAESLESDRNHSFLN